MRPYETLIVLSNELGEGQQPLLERLYSVIQSGGGRIDASRDWGNRRLAYPIRRQSDGHYYLLEYQAEPAVVQELERTLRISDGVLRYMSVQQEHTGLPEPKTSAPRRERGDVPLSELRSGSKPAGREGSGGRSESAPEPAGGSQEASSAAAAAEARPDDEGQAADADKKTEGGEQS